MCYDAYDARVGRSASGGFRLEHKREHEFDRPDGVAKVGSSLKAEMSETGLTVDGRLDIRWNGKELAVKPWGFVLPGHAK